jgi:hypothetical protein
VPGRNHVPPPDSALAPNVAPGREFWLDTMGDDADDPAPLPIRPETVDLAKPNLTRINLAAQLFVLNLNAGQDDATARANADARALQMIP